jgi:polar amino acid transport system substrate-binding protein
MRGNAATRGFAACQLQGACLDNAADKKVVVVYFGPLLRERDRRYDGRWRSRSPWPRLTRTTYAPHGKSNAALPHKGCTRMNISQMMRVVSIALLACLAWGIDALPPALGQGAADDDEAGEREPRRVAIRFLTESDFPPFNYFDEENVLTGFNVDIARAVCLELAATCDIQVRPWADLLPALQKGEADAVVASHTASPNLLKVLDFSEPYYFTPGRFVAKRGLAAVEVTPEGLEGRRIAVAKQTAHEAYLRAFFRDSSIRTYETVELARDALVTGAVDLLFDDGIGLAFWLNGTASKACCDFRGGPFLEPKYFGDGVGIAIKRDDTQLKGMIDTALGRLRQSGRYEELLLRYFPLRVF